MKIDLEFLGLAKKYSLFKIFNQIPNNHNVMEYSIHEYEEGDVTGTLYLENEIIDSFDKVIGNFGVSFEHKIFAYNLKKEGYKDNIISGVSKNETSYRG